MQEVDNLLNIFGQTKDAIDKEDVVKLKELSNHTIHTASITQDLDNVAVAVIVYSLSKIIERGYNKTTSWKKEIISLIDNSIKVLKKEDNRRFRESLQLLREKLENISRDLKSHIQDVFRKASINKASKIYEHGISQETTAKLLGITSFELASYIGQSGISELPESKTMEIHSRIKLAMDIFR